MKLSRGVSNVLVLGTTNSKVLKAVVKNGKQLWGRPIDDIIVDYCDFQIFYDAYHTTSFYDYNVANIRIKIWYPVCENKEEVDIDRVKYMATDNNRLRWRGPLATAMIPIAKQGKQKKIPLLMRRLSALEKSCLKLPYSEYELLEKACQLHLQGRIQQKAKLLEIDL